MGVCCSFQRSEEGEVGALRTGDLATVVGSYSDKAVIAVCGLTGCHIVRTAWRTGVQTAWEVSLRLASDKEGLLQALGNHPIRIVGAFNDSWAGFQLHGLSCEFVLRGDGAKAKTLKNNDWVLVEGELVFRLGPRITVSELRTLR